MCRSPWICLSLSTLFGSASLAGLSRGRRIRLQLQASMLGLYVWPADLSLGLLTFMARALLMETFLVLRPSSFFLACARLLLLLCFLHWQWFRGLIQEQLGTRSCQVCYFCLLTWSGINSYHLFTEIHFFLT